MAVDDAPLLSALGSLAVAAVRTFSGQHLANTAWAFATLSRVHAPLLDAVASAALAKIAECTAQDLAQLAWSFAKVQEDRLRR